mmetsp:Transcript_14602/g.38602  ORF Transcript_14602/g.38602 Transcript_14602/m.38602 type:complete len:209 (-) Transcript_14602:340-966(-)
MLPAPPEKLRRLHGYSAKLLPDVVHQGVREPLLLLVVFLGDLLFFLLAHFSLFPPLLLQVGNNVAEVTLLQLLDRRVVPQRRLPHAPEIINEQVLLFIISSFDPTPIGGDLLCLTSKLDLLTVILDRNPVRLIVRCEHQAVVLEGVPLLGAALATGRAIRQLPPSVHWLVVFLSLGDDLCWSRCGRLSLGELSDLMLQHRLHHHFFLR